MPRPSLPQPGMQIYIKTYCVGIYRAPAKPVRERLRASSLPDWQDGAGGAWGTVNMTADEIPPGGVRVAPMSPSPPTPQWPVFDAHVDSLQRALDLGHDLGAETPGHLDFVRGRSGGLGAVVMVSWVDPSYLEGGPGAARLRTDQLLMALDDLLLRHGDTLAWAGNGELHDKAREADRIAIIPGIEGGHSIEESLEYLEHYFDRGVRVMTLVWNNHLSWIRSCQEGAGPEVPEGLSPLGRDIVRRMNELGMVVDLSHASRRAFYAALEVSSRPVIASHSGCSALHDHPRNLTDQQLKDLAQADGVVGIVFCTPFLDRAAAEEERVVRKSEGYRSLSGENDTEVFLARGEYMQQVLPPFPMERVVDHIIHAASVCGIEHVGLGSDFDGITRRPAGLEHVGCYPALGEALLRRGLNQAEVASVLGGNMSRVYRQVTGPGTRAAEVSQRTPQLT